MSATSPPRKKTIPERIVGFFDHHTEGHISAICSYAGITEDEFRANIRLARTLKVGPNHRLTPMTKNTKVGQLGWWSIRPTDHIIGWADHAELDRNLGAWNTNSKVQAGTKYADQIASIRRNLKFQVADILEQHFAELAISAESDYVVVAVNEAIAEGRVAVPR